MSITTKPYVTGQDDAAWLDIQNRAMDQYLEFTPQTPRDFELTRESPWFSPVGMMLAELDGRAVGCVDAHIETSAPEEKHGFCEGPWVLPEHRRKGVRRWRRRSSRA